MLNQLRFFKTLPAIIPPPNETIEQYTIALEKEKKRQLLQDKISDQLETHKRWLIGDTHNCPGDFSNLNLEEVYLSNYNLTRANFSGVNFSNCNLYGICFDNCKLTAANFKGSILIKCTFRGADLGVATIKNTTVIEGDFSNAVLSPLVIENSYFHKCNFESAVLTYTEWKRAIISYKDSKIEVLDTNTFPDRKLGYRKPTYYS